MAISKTQPMRSAEIEILDKVNALDDANTINVNAIAANADGIETLTRSQSAISSAVQSLSDELGSGFDSVNNVAAAIGIAEWIAEFEGVSIADSIDLISETIDLFNSSLQSLENFAERIKIGETEIFSVPANDSVSSSYVFPTAFTDGDGCIVFLQVVTEELATLFETTLIDCTYSGFSYSVSNSDSDSHDVKLGYVAFKTNTPS